MRAPCRSSTIHRSSHSTSSSVRRFASRISWRTCSARSFYPRTSAALMSADARSAIRQGLEDRFQRAHFGWLREVMIESPRSVPAACRCRDPIHLSRSASHLRPNQCVECAGRCHNRSAPACGYPAGRVAARSLCLACAKNQPERSCAGDKDCRALFRSKPYRPLQTRYPNGWREKPPHRGGSAESLVGSGRSRVEGIHQKEDAGARHWRAAGPHARRHPAARPQTGSVFAISGRCIGCARVAMCARFRRGERTDLGTFLIFIHRGFPSLFRKWGLSPFPGQELHAPHGLRIARASPRAIDWRRHPHRVS